MSGTEPESTARTVSTSAGAPEDVTLRSGSQLSVAEVDELARQNPVSLIALVGPPGVGKTTFVAAIYERLRVAKLSGVTFAGSLSLVAFEERAHLSRVASNLDRPLTQRTSSSDEQLFYHLRSPRTDGDQRKQDLLFLDVAGEDYEGLRTSHDACLAIDSFKRIDHLVLFLDSEKLSKPASRFLAVEQGLNFLNCVWDSGAMSRSCRLHVVTSRADKLAQGESAPIAAEIKKTFRARLGDRFPDIEFLKVAARPDAPGIEPEGLDTLVKGWLAKEFQVPAVELGNLSEVRDERESESFLARQINSKQSK